MAQGRPLSRHGRYDAFIGMQVKEPVSNDLYGKSDYMNSSYNSPRPKSGYKNRGQASAYEYDQYARVTTPREEPPARPVSRRGADRYGGTSSRRMSVEDSDESFASSPPVPPSVSPESNHSRTTGYHRPPSSASGRPPSGRPKSARIRSAKKLNLDTDNVNIPYIPDNDMPDLTSARPPSSFSKYRPLPSIGTPTPPDFGEDHNDDVKIRTHHPNHLYNVISEPGPQKQKPYQHSQQPHHNSSRGHHSHQPAPHPPQSSSGKRSLSGRVSSAVSDISVISTRANSRSNPPQVELANTADLIERLDLSKLDKEGEEQSAAVAAGRRRKPSGSSSVHHGKSSKPSSGNHQKKSDVDPGDLYDGDDDDSDTASIPGYSAVATVTKQDTAKVAAASPKDTSPPLSRRAVKKTVVVIPSPNEPAVCEILLAIKLPTDGTRHQRYFRTDERLQAVVQFAEEVAGQDFGGYILVATAPKNVYRDLDETIESAGLEDKTVLHLEEND